MAKEDKFGKKYEAIAGSIIDEVTKMENLKTGDGIIQPVPTIRTKTSKRVSLHKRKQN